MAAKPRLGVHNNCEIPITNRKEAELAAVFLCSVAGAVRKVLDIPVSVTDEFAEDGAMPAEWWQPATVPADLPIGQILKLSNLSDRTSKQDSRDDRDDTGEGHTITAG